MNTDESETAATEELRMIFQATLDDIEKAKQWQWTLFYNCAAAQAAMLALYSAYSVRLPFWLRFAFPLLCIAILILGIQFIRDTTRQLKAYRHRNQICRKFFHPRTLTLLEESTRKTGSKKMDIGKHLIASLSLVTFISAALMVWLAFFPSVLGE